MSLRIQDMCLHSSRQYHADLLSWSVRNQGKFVRLRVVQSSIIPRHSLTRLLRASMTLRHLNPVHTLGPMIPIMRLNSTLSSAAPPTTTTTASASPSASTTFTKSPKAPSHEEFLHIIEKRSKTSNDLVKIKEIMLEFASSDSMLFRKHKFQALKILLRYKKFEFVNQLLSCLKDELTQEDHIIITYKLACTGDFEIVKKNLLHWDASTLNSLLDSCINLILDQRGPKCALQLWITVVSIPDPQLKLGSHLFHKSLNKIVSAFSDVNDLRFIFTFLSSESAKSNLLSHLGHRYAKIGCTSQAKRLWNITPPALHTHEYFDFVIQILFVEGEISAMFDLLLAHPQLHSKKSLRLLVRKLPKLHYMNSAHYDLVKALFKGNILFSYQASHILRVLLKAKHYHKFDELISIYSSHKNPPNVDIINCQMERALARHASSTRILEYLRNIQEVDLKPNTDTFLILLKQFAKIGDSKSAFSLFELQIQRGDNVSIRHVNLVMDACVKNQDVETLPKINEYMKSLNIEPDLKFIESLMSLHLILHQYSRVQDLFLRVPLPHTTVIMHASVLKSFILSKDYLAAHITFNGFIDRFCNKVKCPDYYLVLVDYYTMLGNFEKALSVIQEVKSRGFKQTNRFFESLMKGYNKHGKFKDALSVFNAVNQESRILTRTIYHELLVSLVQLSIINKDNFEDPIAVIDNIIREARDKSLKLHGDLPFLVVKPVIHALTKYYKPDDAYRIMTNYRTVNPGYAVDQKLNYMKQELLLFSAIDKWGSFGITYDNFQNKIKSMLTVDGISPTNLKKVYNSVIKKIYKFYYLKSEIKEFAKLFHDLIFVHGFTFTSNSINWVVRRLIMDKRTFHDAMYLVERKLISGHIAKYEVKLEMAQSRRLGERPIRNVAHGRYLPRRLMLGYIYKPVIERRIYNYIMGGKRFNKEKRVSIIEDLKEKYPKTMESLPLIFKRMRRRERHFASLKHQYPNKSIVESLAIVKAYRKGLKRKEIKRKRKLNEEKMKILNEL